MEAKIWARRWRRSLTYLIVRSLRGGQLQMLAAGVAQAFRRRFVLGHHLAPQASRFAPINSNVFRDASRNDPILTRAGGEWQRSNPIDLANVYSLLNRRGGQPVVAFDSRRLEPGLMRNSGGQRKAGMQLENQQGVASVLCGKNARDGGNDSVRGSTAKKP